MVGCWLYWTAINDYSRVEGQIQMNHSIFYEDTFKFMDAIKSELLDIFMTTSSYGTFQLSYGWARAFIIPGYTITILDVPSNEKATYRLDEIPEIINMLRHVNNAMIAFHDGKLCTIADRRKLLIEFKLNNPHVTEINEIA